MEISYGLHSGKQLEDENELKKGHLTEVPWLSFKKSQNDTGFQLTILE